jgi:hypothetical protein
VNVAANVPPTSAQRLDKFFELIRQEFDGVAEDSSVWKGQRDEYEAKRECKHARDSI